MKTAHFFALVVLLAVSSCARQPAEVAEANQSATTAAPSMPATVVPTKTVAPSPTATSAPSPTTEPTDTPAPPVPSPLATLEPTATPPPPSTATATIPASVTPRPLPPAPASTSTPSADAAVAVREMIGEAIAEMNRLRWALDPGNEIYNRVSPTDAIDCQTVIASRERVLTLIQPGEPSEPASVQNARAAAAVALTQFNAATSPLIDSCRQALAAGSATVIIHKSGYYDLVARFAEVEAIWNQAIHMLDP